MSSPRPPLQARPDDQTSGRSPGGTNQPSFFWGWPGRRVRAAVVQAWAPPRRTQDLTFSTSFQGIELLNKKMATASAEAVRQCPRSAVRTLIRRGRGTAQGPTLRHQAGTRLLGRKHYPSPWAAMGRQLAECHRQHRRGAAQLPRVQAKTQATTLRGGVEIFCHDLEDQKLLTQTARGVKTSERSGARGPVGTPFFIYLRRRGSHREIER